MSGGGSSNSTGLVTNPMHAALSQLYAKLQGDASTMSGALKAANQQMTAGGTWVGSAAQSWGTQLDGYSRDCTIQVNAMLADVSQALQGEPAQVTMQVAEQKSRLIMMMERDF